MVASIFLSFHPTYSLCVFHGTFPVLDCSVIALLPGYTAMVMLGRSVNLTTHLLGRHRPTERFHSTQCPYLSSNWQLPFLNQWKGGGGGGAGENGGREREWGNDRRKKITINFHESVWRNRISNRYDSSVRHASYCVTLHCFENNMTVGHYSL